MKRRNEHSKSPQEPGAEAPQAGASGAAPEAFLARLRVVLVRTQHPGNIGSTARAMKTMGLSDLVLVAPDHPPDETSFALASGAADIIDRAVVRSSLTDAVADCQRVVGLSARRRGISLAVSDARDWARRWAEATAGAADEGGRTALVFGAERTGLTNAELALCQECVQIAANPAYSSLNLAQAVQVLAYEARHALLGGVTQKSGRRRPADHATMEGVYGHLEATLVTIGFLDPDNPRHLMRRLRRLFARAEPDAVEANILRGIFSAVQKAASDKAQRGG